MSIDSKDLSYCLVLTVYLWYRQNSTQCSKQNWLALFCLYLRLYRFKSPPRHFCSLVYVKIRVIVVVISCYVSCYVKDNGWKGLLPLHVVFVNVYLYQTKYLCVLYFVILQTVLMMASAQGHKDIVDTLLAHKADVNLKSVRIIFNRLIYHRYIYHIVWSHAVVFILTLSLHSATYV